MPRQYNNRGGGFRGRGRGSPKWPRGGRSSSDNDYGGYTPSFNNRGGSKIAKRGSTSSHNRRGGPNYQSKPIRPLGYLVKVVNAKDEDQMELMQSLEQKVGSPLNATNINTRENDIEFVVSSEDLSRKLDKLSGQLKNSKGRKMPIFCKPWFGDRSLPPEEEKKLMELMSQFYKAETKFLDMSNFLEKQDRPGVGLKKFFISQKTIGSAVCKIIGANIPELEVLDLSNNALFNMYPFSELFSKAPKLNKLNISFNRMEHVAQLDPIKNLKLIELNLDGNPMCNHYSDQSTYVKDIHKRFPQVVMLDGHQIKTSIGFDLDTTVTKSMPLFRGNVVENYQWKDRVYLFLESYFKVFDMDTRDNLQHAYDTNAKFSLTIMFMDQNVRENLKMNKYFNITRNLTRVYDERTKEARMYNGKFKVLALLSEFPTTEHDLNSFRIDIMLETPKLVIFCVSGALREKGNSIIYIFNSTFTCKEYMGGLQIVNHILHYRLATEYEKKRTFTNPGPTPSNSPVVPQTETIVVAGGVGTSTSSVPAQMPPPTVAATVPTLTEEQKQELTNNFSLESGLKLHWSVECLQANQWDYHRAAADFQRAKSSGTIPADAYN